MADTHLIVSADAVGRRLGLMTLTAEQRTIIEDYIEDAQDAVVGHIGRPIVPAQVTRTGLYPQPGEDVSSWRAWGADLFDDAFEVVTAERQTNGSYTVEFKVGLDGSNVRPIVRYVRAHAAEALVSNPAIEWTKRVVSSMSAEGQSLSFESSKAAKGDAGALPDLSTLDRYVRRTAYQAARQWPGPWPMASAPVGWSP